MQKLSIEKFDYGAFDFCRSKKFHTNKLYVKLLIFLFFSQLLSAHPFIYLLIGFSEHCRPLIYDRESDRFAYFNSDSERARGGHKPLGALYFQYPRSQMKNFVRILTEGRKNEKEIVSVLLKYLKKVLIKK